LKVKDLINASVDVSQKKGEIKKGGIFEISMKTNEISTLTFVKFPARPECL
jgi:hypothetical protein